jgi:hypothetical protein
MGYGSKYNKSMEGKHGFEYCGRFSSISPNTDEMVSFDMRLAILALMTGYASIANAATGKTTRYWDCCKGSCGWTGKASVSHPITSCDKSDNPLSDFAAKNACDNGGGTAYMCSNQSPWAVNDNLALGFAAVKLSGGTESSWCCACYKYAKYVDGQSNS